VAKKENSNSLESLAKGQYLSKEERLTILVERYLEVSRENKVLKAKVSELEEVFLAVRLQGGSI